MSKKIVKKKKLQNKNELPSRVVFEPISHCVLSCEFCMLQELQWWKYRRKTVMSFADFKKIIDDISWFTTRVVFSGGEPLLNPDIFKMLRYCRKNHITSFLATNGVLLGMKNNIQNLVKDPPDTVEIAYESKDVYVTTKTKKGGAKGDFDILVKNIEGLVDAKRKSKQRYPIISLLMVLTKKNKDKTNIFWKEVKKLGADYGKVKSLGIWPEGSVEYDKKMAKEYIVPRSEHPTSRYNIDSKGDIIFSRKPGFCAAAKKRYVTICSGGEVIPCEYIVVKTKIMGNAVDENLVDIWNSKKYRKYRDEMLHGQANPLCYRCLGTRCPGTSKIGRVVNKRKLNPV